MDKTQALITAANQLRELFADKSELKGFDDWDVFIGSIVLIEGVAAQLQRENETEEESEG